MNNKFKLLKNTFSLYIRTIVLTCISLYTVRVVLKILGASDYGIYNTVGGFVFLFSFLSGNLSNSLQRYFSIYLAKNDWNGLNKIYSLNLTIVFVFLLIILIITETIGVWFILSQLNYPTTRTSAALIVYQTSVLSFAFGMFSITYQALLIADENLSVYSIVSIVEGIFKLVFLYILSIISMDKLSLYAILTMISTLSINIFYIFYAIKKYPLLKFKLFKKFSEYKELFIYINWNLIGSIAAVAKVQGINLIINLFFGTKINAARGIAYQINNSISSFSQNFMKALSPYLTKSYALKDNLYFNNQMVISSKISFLLLFVLAIPFIFNSRYVFSLWLGSFPEFTCIFTILVLVDSLIGSITEPLLTGVQATGKVKIYQIIIGGLNLLNLPLSFYFLCHFNNPTLPFIVAICISSIMGVARIIVFKRVYDFNMRMYILNAIFPLFLITIISSLFTYFFFSNSNSLLELICKSVLSLIVNFILIFFIACRNCERKAIYNFLISRFSFCK